MPTRSRFVCLVFLMGGLHVLAGTAAAQTKLYVAGGGFADVKRFNSATYRDQDNQNTTSLGGSVRVGTFVAPKWSLELAIDASRKTATNQTDIVILSIYPPLPNFNLTPTNQFTSVGVLVGFHPEVSGRIRPGYLGGISFLRGKYTTAFFIPLGLDTTAILNGLPDFGVGQLTALNFPQVTDIRYTTSVTLGIEAAIDVSKHLAVVPELRVLTVSAPDGLLLRPGVDVRWLF
jgi:hypothetical protein